MIEIIIGLVAFYIGWTLSSAVSNASINKRITRLSQLLAALNVSKEQVTEALTLIEQQSAVSNIIENPTVDNLKDLSAVVPIVDIVFESQQFIAYCDDKFLAQQPEFDDLINTVHAQLGNMVAFTSEDTHIRNLLLESKTYVSHASINE